MYKNYVVYLLRGKIVEWRVSKLCHVLNWVVPSKSKYILSRIRVLSEGNSAICLIAAEVGSSQPLCYDSQQLQAEAATTDLSPE